MKATIDKAQALAIRLGIGWFVLFTISAICASVMTGLAGADWSELDGQSRLMMGLGMILSWTNTMMAFAKQARAQLVAGKDPLADVSRMSPPPAPESAPFKL